MFDWISHYIASIGMLSSILLVFLACVLEVLPARRNAVSRQSKRNILKGAMVLFAISTLVIIY
ncbi:MAG: hypothetical protein QXW10_01730 [Candidatus Micrarchaeaceae archaeon]